MARKGYKNVVRGSQEEIKARGRILAYYKNTPIPDSEILVNLGLYLPATQAAKVQYPDEL